MRRNYLRVRGEYVPNDFIVGFHRELPPRARRILRKSTIKAPKCGTTSACAENTRIMSWKSVESRNYLRVRGEYIRPELIASSTRELPPRARRILAPTASKKSNLRTTSACAENTLGPGCCRESVWNYLRVRGEYLSFWRGLFCESELPPRARRIHGWLGLRSARKGTTSACAENTNRRMAPCRHPRNYLRVRGEY